MGLFDPALVIGSADILFGTDAVYTPPVPDAAGVPFTLLSSTEDGELTIAGARGRAMRAMFEVLRSELADPQRNGVILHKGIAWQIAETPASDDADRLIWTLRCQVAASP